MAWDGITQSYRDLASKYAQRAASARKAGNKKLASQYDEDAKHFMDKANKARKDARR